MATSSEAPHPLSPKELEARRRAGIVSLFSGVVIMAGKFGAYALTGSAAIFSDATESIVNVVAALVLLFTLRIAAQPADQEHPYGHGKAEFFSAALEGSAILAAAVLILVEAGPRLLAPPPVERLDLGLLVLAISGGANLALGLYLVKAGERTRSTAIVADGRHVLTDVWTSAGVLGGLVAVRITGLRLLDPLLAVLVAIHILFEGYKLLREAVNGLMDTADPELLRRLTATLEAHRRPSYIDVHQMRAAQAGDPIHADLHMTVPRYYDVAQTHAIDVELTALFREQTGRHVGLVIHFDPCRPHHCPGCAMEACPVRAQPFGFRPPFDVASVTRRVADPANAATEASDPEAS